ncbi:PAS domain-containing protein [Thalassobaculum sp. OXR-137]|uniref:PAS domain-containing protein n=1 Tax=Thalassobaculum sp. OXR-137 TaxID=3100173 RepID=UPI002AC9B840|nr:PAS domain-containing protein [Thalassobaculum sp. OXR-137]WPZ33557.1 PAS domain-containing protein [Thalassobaculum sp. OXR-137]
MSADPPRPHPRLAGADPRILDLLDGWRAARHGQAVAQRSAFDPLTIAAMLEYVWIYRLAPERDDYVCDLAGEEVNTVWGSSIKGRTLTEIVGASHRQTLARRWDDARSTPAILYSTTEDLPDPHFVHRVERLVLPMTGRTGEIDSVLGVSLYDLRRDRLSSNTDTQPAMPAAVVRIPAAEL